MIDSDLFHLERLALALEYFSGELGAGALAHARQTAMHPSRPSPGCRPRTLELCPTSTPPCRTGVDLPCRLLPVVSGRGTR